MNGLLPLAPAAAPAAPALSPTRQAGQAFGDILETLVTAADRRFRRLPEEKSA